MTNQPQWELVHATDYSALYRDATGVFPPELVIAQTCDDVDEDNIEATSAYVYRFSLDRLYQHADDNGGTYLANEHGNREWFQTCHGGLQAVADSIGSSLADLVADLCSDDPRRLASAYEAIGGYRGYENFDSYPQEWTEHEFAEWPDRGARLSTDERDEFTQGYISCALWCGVMAYKHDDDCPCADDPSDSDACTCEDMPELTSSDDEHDESDLTDDARETLTRDAHEFYADHIEDLRASTLTMERAGHDFWLTRNRHGAGFWDRKHRGTDEDRALDRLTDASHAYGGMDLVVGADGIGVL